MTKFKMYSLDPVTPYILLRHSKWINSMYLPGRLFTLFIQKYKNIIQTMGIATLCLVLTKLFQGG